MSDYTIAAWAIVILAELLLASVAVNVVGAWRHWCTKAGGPPAGLVRRIKAITEKAPVIRDLYHRITSDSGAETPAFLDRLQMETKQLQELLQDSAATHKPLRPDAFTAMLQPVWQEMPESYALLHTTMPVRPAWDDLDRHPRHCVAGVQNGAIAGDRRLDGDAVSRHQRSVQG